MQLFGTTSGTTNFKKYNEHKGKIGKKMIGQKIRKIRGMTQQEIDAEGWDRGTTLIELEDGRTIFASQDDEGNGPGAMFSLTPKGEQVAIFVDEENNG